MTAARLGSKLAGVGRLGTTHAKGFRNVVLRVTPAHSHEPSPTVLETELRSHEREPRDGLGPPHAARASEPAMTRGSRGRRHARPATRPAFPQPPGRRTTGQPHTRKTAGFTSAICEAVACVARLLLPDKGSHTDTVGAGYVREHEGRCRPGLRQRRAFRRKQGSRNHLRSATQHLFTDDLAIHPFAAIVAVTALLTVLSLALPTRHALRTRPIEAIGARV